MSLYYRDPDDNGVELSIDNIEKAQWHDWMRNSMKDNPIGAPMDPMSLRENITQERPKERRAGAPISDQNLIKIRPIAIPMSANPAP
jgi:hypothetical protein